MRRDAYESLLLEIRQSLKEKEDSFKQKACVNLLLYKKVKLARRMVQQELINYRIGCEKDKNLVNLMEG